VANHVFWVRVEAKSSSFKSDLEKLIQSEEGFTIRQTDDNGKVDLLIFELGDDREKELQAINSLLEGGNVGEVFLTSRVSDPEVLLQAMRIGVKEFFPYPPKVQKVTRALERFRSRSKKLSKEESVTPGRIIGILGGKGGVGTTTVAVNLAVSLAEKNGDQSVALLDMNMFFGEIPLFMEMNPRHHWGEITKNISRLDNTFLMNTLCRHSSGVCVLPSPNHLSNNHRMPTETMIEHLLSLMQKNFDFVVVDGGKHLNEPCLKVLEMSDSVLLISELNFPALANTKNLLESFRRLGRPRKECVKVLINRYTKKSPISLKDAEKGIGEKIFWTIPNDYLTTMSAINAGKPFSHVATKAAITKNIQRLTNVFLDDGKKQEKKIRKFFRRR
jgi:pilus assembly protein CpaE